LHNSGLTDWIYIFSEKRDFRALAKIKGHQENLIGEWDKPRISTIWIFKSSIISLEVEETPITIGTPHRFERPYSHLNYDLKQLIKKLKNPKIRIDKFDFDSKTKEFWKRIQ